MRKLVKTKTTEIVPLSRKQEKRDIRREKKALVAAQLETAIEKELVERLKQVHHYKIHVLSVLIGCILKQIGTNLSYIYPKKSP